MAWKKGHSGNPKGRKKGSRNRDKEVEELISSGSVASLRLLKRLVDTDEAGEFIVEANMTDRVKAAFNLIDRDMGKPETAGNSAAGLFQGATIMVDTGIRRELAPPTVDVTPVGSVNGQERGED